MNPEIEYEVYREEYHITEYRNGAIFKTERVGFVWVDKEEAKHPKKPDTIYAPVPYKEEVRLWEEEKCLTIRRKL